jgi:hypothetical protein
MPRQLESTEETLQGLAPLQPQSNPKAGGRAVSRGEKKKREMRRDAKLKQLKPYTLSLTPEDVAQCEILENAAFPPHERCSRGKVCVADLDPTVYPLLGIWFMQRARELLATLNMSRIYRFVTNEDVGYKNTVGV